MSDNRPYKLLNKKPNSAQIPGCLRKRYKDNQRRFYNEPRSTDPQILISLRNSETYIDEKMPAFIRYYNMNDGSQTSNFTSTPASVDDVNV